MAEVVRPDPEYKRPIVPLPEKRGLRGGGPTMKVPGDGGIRKQVQPQGAGREERSAANYGDAMSSIGGPATEPDRKYQKP
jgi:hypothetical protein